MMKYISIAGSNSSTSINQKLIGYLSQKLGFGEVFLTQYEIPIYSIDEEQKGFPKKMEVLYNVIFDAEVVMISVAEHNGNLTAFFKNIIDWLSRYKRNFLENKKVVLLSASPGKMGAKSALEIAKNMLPHFGGEIIYAKSIANFNGDFSGEEFRELVQDIRSLL
ncbi:NAD(P)H-dependent oxidoreductase [Riemerella anatipestifer]|nr:NAD(P)H-dependent oxidoreductase [Riemerella anatipestifer]